MARGRREQISLRHLPRRYLSRHVRLRRDASMRPQDSPDSTDLRKPVNVQITGAALSTNWTVHRLHRREPYRNDAHFPGIRRALIDSRPSLQLRALGVPYVVRSMHRRSAVRADCRAARRQGRDALPQALNLAGGAPPTWTASRGAAAIDRPEQASADFTYFAAGDLIPAPARAARARADDTVTQNPLSDRAGARLGRLAIVHELGQLRSDRTRRARWRRQEAAYRCRVNDKPLVNDEAKNFAYPWRDNCLRAPRPTRSANVRRRHGPSGPGYSPELLPGTRSAAGRCEPYQEDVVAVSDGVLVRDSRRPRALSASSTSPASTSAFATCT